ncbi:M4 family metallopeptidase [Tumebacillus sp. DT12]|uniref:Neutral metalloproteinase n=1 Tax=Tumebacillus lacus TaxID=2995335 RepID=A0ABT3WYA1_9BACL|nr:M4 family metallopeptidase [Tumebacillus lacus]MCX7569649.1 M4 family metallopeptidase [Tumebacillus lacus]
MNKKFVATLVLSSLVASAFAINAGAASDKQTLKDETGKVHSVDGKLGKLNGKTAEERALSAIEKVKGDFKIKADSKFKSKSSHKDENGTTHTKLNQTINGIPVFGSELIVHEANGDLQGVSGDYKALTANADKASLTDAAAIDAAVASTGFTGELSSPAQAELVYFPQGDQAVLSYKVNVSYLADIPGRWTVFVNAVDGSIVSATNKIESATGVGVLGDSKTINTTAKSGTYYLEDRTKYMTTYQGNSINTYNFNYGTSSQYYFTDADNYWNSTVQRAAVDAHYYAGKVYDYYKNSLGRNSYNGAGAAIISGVHYSSNYNNAFWEGTQMVYGDGDGSTFRALSGAYDVVAHELTHAVTEHTSGLIYENQSGALNESWSDAMAAVMDSADWQIGEDVYTPGISGDALRSMSDPASEGQPAHMNQYQNLPNTEAGDWGGVHTNSGIPNKAFYNFATAIGSRANAGKVWYTASRDYMTSTTNFSGARAATLKAAAALYGSTSSTYTALANAWSSVGVY